MYSRLISESEDATSNIANPSQPATNGVAEGSVSPGPQPETSQTPEVPVEALETIELMQEQCCKMTEMIGKMTLEQLISL